MKTKTAALLMLSAGLTVGCAQDQNQKHLDADAAARNAPIAPDPVLSANTHFAAGQVAESRGDFARAIAQYDEALKIDPKMPAPWSRLAIIYTTSKQYDQATDAWNHYIKATNNAAAGYSDLGLTLEQGNRLTEAESAYKTGIAREPRNEFCRVNYGLMLARQGRLNEAAAQMQVVLSSAQVHYNIASVLESQGKKTAARAEFEKATAADPEMTEARQRLAELDKN